MGAFPIFKVRGQSTISENSHRVTYRERESAEAGERAWTRYAVADEISQRADREGRVEAIWIYRRLLRLPLRKCGLREIISA